jgi:hypothetical protein
MTPPVIRRLRRRPGRAWAADASDDVRALHFPAAAKKLLGFGQRPTFRKEAAGIALILLQQRGGRSDPRLGAQQLAIIERVSTVPAHMAPLIK